MLDATCPLCFTPFGRLSQAPFALTCGHVFCIGCLRSENTVDCRLCGTDLASHLNSQIQNLWRSISHQTGLPTSGLGDGQPAPMEPRKLDEAIAGINKSTPLSYISRLHSTCEAFLEEQPRSKCKDLATHLSLLGLLLDQKLIVQHQNELVGSLTHEIQRLRNQKSTLQAHVEAMSASHKQREQGSGLDANIVGRLLRGDTEHGGDNLSRRPSRDEGQAPSLTWPPEPQGSFLMQPVVPMTPEIKAPVARHSMKHFMDSANFSDVHLRLRAVSDLQNTDDSLLVPEERRTIEKLQSTGYVPHVSNTSQPSSLDAQGARRASLPSITHPDAAELPITSPTPGDSSFMSDSITLLKTPDNGSKQLSPINMGPFVFGTDPFPHRPLLAAILQPDLVPLPPSPLSSDRFVTLDLNPEHLRNSSPKPASGRPLSQGSTNAGSFTTQSSEDVVETVQEQRRLHLMEVLANICMDEQLSASSSSTSISSATPDADTPHNGGSVWDLDFPTQQDKAQSFTADRTHPYRSQSQLHENN